MCMRVCVLSADRKTQLRELVAFLHLYKKRSTHNIALPAETFICPEREMAQK